MRPACWDTNQVFSSLFRPQRRQMHGRINAIQYNTGYQNVTLVRQDEDQA